MTMSYMETSKTLEIALHLCEVIENNVEVFPRRDSLDLPESAGKFVERIAPKLQSLNDYFTKKGYLSDPQKKLLLGILGGLEKWTDRHDT